MRHDTVRIGYASCKNISFKGYVDTMISWEEWNEMWPREQREVIDSVIENLVDVWVEDE